MKTIFVLLIFFLAIGVFARSNNRGTRVVLSAGILAVILYLYVA
jgi:hypothetical protein